MTKTITAISAALALAALAACSPADPEAAADSPTTTTTHASSSTYTAPATTAMPTPTLTEEDITERAYLQVLADNGVQCNDNDCLLAAITVCNFLDDGHHIDDLFMELAYNKVMGVDAERVFPFAPNEQIPYIVGASIAGYCPEYEYQLNN